MTSIDKLAREMAARLRAERARSDLTLKQAAAKSGLHYGSISRYELGKLPTIEALYALAEAYGVEPAAFLPERGTVSWDPAEKFKSKVKAKK